MGTYDYLIVGAGLFGAVFAHEAKKKGKNCLVIEKRDILTGKAPLDFEALAKDDPSNNLFQQTKSVDYAL